MKRLPGVSLLAALGAYYLVQTHLISNLWRLTDDYTLALRLYQFSAFVNVAVLCGIVFLALSPRDILARVLWAIAFVLETYSILEYTACKILGDTYDKADLDAIWGVSVPKSSCDRVVGPLGSWAEIGVAALIVGWITWRYLKTRTRA